MGAQAEYQSWEDAMEAQIESSRSGSLVILELGVGRRVEVVRKECEEVMKDVGAKRGHVTLVRVNPDADLSPSAGSDFSVDCSSEVSERQRLICLQMTAQEALKGFLRILCPTEDQ